MRCFLAILLLFSSGLVAQAANRKRNPAHPKSASVPHFMLWETRQDLRKRTGNPEQYFVPRIQKLIRPKEVGYYRDNYKTVDDVFYRRTSLGEVRILVAFAIDGSESHLNPEVRVSKIHFIFDKDVVLRDALNALDELRELCAGGCILNGFSSMVVAQPATPNDAQIAVARKMRPQWRGQDMSDATPGAEIYYADSPYPVDFEHSPVERIDLTLVSNAGEERYSLTVVDKDPTVLDIWHPPARHEKQVAAK
jgi:hypothetical protein